mgnify:CR=1 FL=1
MTSNRKTNGVLFIITPFLCLLLGLAMIVSQQGLPMEERPGMLQTLATAEEAATDQEAKVLLLCEEETALLQTVEDVLDAMRLPYRTADACTPEELLSFQTVLVCGSSLSSLEGEGAVELMNWVADGGRLAFMAVPSTDSFLRVLGHKLGIMDGGREYREYQAFKVLEGTLDVFDGLTMDEELSDYTLSLRLEDDCRVYMETADEAGTPLLWSREIGEGKVCVCNHTLIGGKDSRGHVIMTLRALEDVLVYPIINCGVICIDDFPAPQPEGFDEWLRQQYGLSTQGFFRNHWWPDMKSLAKRFGLRYTGVLVETYNRVMEPPFLPDNEDHSLIRYYTSELLQAGGEVGLHGYNHQPLCMDGWQYAGEGYDTWHTEEDMRLAVEALVAYGHTFLPETRFTSYVPPSNYLSDEGKKVLIETVPDLLAISGLYLPETGVNARVQEFQEEEDGTVSVPRITSGFTMDAYLKLVASGELALHGAFSHFIHPDDVLDAERGALLGWETMRDTFEADLEAICDAYPCLRFCTVTEAAAAVQRYDRLQMVRQWEGKTLVLNLSPFYDEAWLSVCASDPPLSVSGAEIYPVGNGALWLRATSPEVRLTWEAAP